MGNPITWQNVNSPDGRLVSQLLAGAQQGITGGFDKLGDIITQREAVNQGAADRARGAAEQEFMNQLYGYKNPAELQAARESGALAQQLAGLDPRNQAAARTALDARLGTLQTQTNANDTFAVGQVKQPMVMANAAADVANANDLRAQARMKIDRDNKVLPTQYATDALAAANNNRAEVFKGTRAPGLEALTLREDVLKGDTLTVTAKQTRDTLEDQKLAAATAKVATAYQVSQTEERTKLGALASKLGMPVDATGAPDIARIAPDALLFLNTKAARSGLRTTDQLNSGNTKARNNFIQSLAGQGFSAESIARNTAKISPAFDTVGTTAVIGNDAYNNALKQAKVDTAQESSDANNWYAPGSPNALKSYEELNTQIAPMFDKSKGSDMYEDLPDIQDLLYKASTQGIEVKKGVFLVPSKQDMMAAIRSHTGDYNLTNNERAQDIEKTLKKNLDTSRVTDLIKQSEASKSVNEARSIREKVRDALYGAPAKK